MKDAVTIYHMNVVHEQGSHMRVFGAGFDHPHSAFRHVMILWD